MIAIPNIIYYEDAWNRIPVGNVELAVVKPCARQWLALLSALIAD